MLRQLAISCLIALLTLTADARTRPHYGGTLHVEVEGDPLQQHGGLARRLIFDGLTHIGNDGTAQPTLAIRWASESSDHRWQFWLRPDVHFSDGSLLTSAAVESSLTASCTANCPWTAVHAVGSSVVFTGDSPMPNLPALLAGGDFLIAHPVFTDSAPIPGTGSVVGTGPFQISGLVNGILTLVANDSCWRGRPFLDKTEIYGHKSIRDQWLDLSVGHADLVEVPPEQLRLAQQQHLTVVASPPVTLLALAVADSSVLANPSLRAAIAFAVDRSALSNVIFQKQGEVTASLLPTALTGYSFLFPTDRDLNKAHEVRGGLNTPSLTLTADNNPTMQLAAQRLALNLNEAGFNVQVANATSALHKDLALLELNLATSQPQPALESIFRSVGVSTPVVDNTPTGLYRVERDFLQTHTLIPLLYLPRAFAISGRVRDLRLNADGSPLLADVSLEDAQ